MKLMLFVCVSRRFRAHSRGFDGASEPRETERGTEGRGKEKRENKMERERERERERENLSR